jgi:DNA polymerase-1
MIKVAMVNIQKAIAEKKLRTRMILQVHDELVFEVPEQEKDIIEPLIRHEMESAVTLSIPVVVDIGWGNNWAEAH